LVLPCVFPISPLSLVTPHVQHIEVMLYIGNAAAASKVKAHCCCAV
jgi:hypothetical protein